MPLLTHFLLLLPFCCKLIIMRPLSLFVRWYFRLFIAWCAFLQVWLCTSFRISQRATSQLGLLRLSSTVKIEPTTELYQDLKFAILGGGAFSLALSKVLSYKNISCNLLVRNQTVADNINTNHYHPKYLTGSKLPLQLWATSDPKLALDNVDYVIHAVPMQQSRQFLSSIKPLLDPKTPLLSVTKGVEVGTFSLMNDIIGEVLGPEQRCAFLSGPSFAQEIMDGEATAVVIASTDAGLAKEFAEILSCVEFRCHTASDVLGVELGGAIKNVIALAAGMCEGLDLGMNSLSSLVTRGCTEMSRMGMIIGADQETFFGLAGVGDTFCTCLGPLSRNRKVGYRLAKGERLEDILASSDGVSEGVYTVLALEQLIKTKVRPNVYEFKFPIISGVAQIVKGNITPRFGLNLLMRYPIRDENTRNRGSNKQATATTAVPPPTVPVTPIPIPGKTGTPFRYEG